jgi:hypothetical protein
MLVFNTFHASNYSTEYGIYQNYSGTFFSDEDLAPDGCCGAVLPASCQCYLQQQSMHRDGLQIVLQLPE